LFQGSNATGDCCSRCWVSVKPKDDATTKKEGSGDELEKAKAQVAESTGKLENDSAEVAVPSVGDSAKVGVPSVKDAMKAAFLATLGEPDVTATADPPSPAKKKKKKTTYKNMLAGMLEGSSASRDIEKEKEKLKDVTGGGHFQKIDKI